MKQNKFNLGSLVLTLFIGIGILIACTDDIINEEIQTEEEYPSNISISVTQDWDNPAVRSMPAEEPKVSDNLFTADGIVGNQPVYIYTTEVEGIRGDKEMQLAAPAITGEQATSEASSHRPGINQPQRGILIGGGTGTNTNNMFYNNFRLYSAVNPADTKATSDGNNNWTVNQPITFTDDNPVTFYGVAPYGNYSGFTHTNPIITYTTPQYAESQTDLMTAKTTVRESDNGIHLPFRHILSGVKFKIGAKGLANPSNTTRIKQIYLEGIYTQGTYNVETDTWTYTNTGTVSQSTSWEGLSLKDKGIGNDNGGLMITNDAQGTTFLVMPQTLPANATLKIIIEENGVEGTPITAKLSGTWKQGYTKTYNITSTKSYPGYVLQVENNLTFDYESNCISPSLDYFTVTSYKNNKDKTPLGWSINGYSTLQDDDTWSAYSSTNNTFVTKFSATSGTGGQSGEIVTPTVRIQTKTTVTNQYRRNELRNNPRPEKTARFDLSLYKVDNDTPWPGGRTTANTYVVRQAGLYKIPLVIGNTLKNGQVNTPEKYIAASANTGEGLGTFVNYKNQIVRESSGNWNLTEATTAEIVWTDSPSTCIAGENISIATEDGYKYLYFTVDKSTIEQSNTVIAVKNSSGVVLWSWLIYVTDTDLTQTIEVKHDDVNPSAYYFAPEYIGYVESNKLSNIWGADREMKVRIVQQESGQTGEVSILQFKYERTQINCYSALFQYGRKDAFIGKPYSETDIKIEKAALTSRTIQSTIQNPNTFYANISNAGGTSQDWCQTTYWNLWSATNTQAISTSTTYNDNVVIKTIYDPSPAGFHMPPSNAFIFTTKKIPSDATSAIATSASDAEYNGYPFQGKDKAYTFYTKTHTTLNTFFFPFTGWRRHDTGALGSTTIGITMWCAVPRNKDYGTVARIVKSGSSFEFGGDINSRSHFNRSYAATLLPVAD